MGRWDDETARHLALETEFDRLSHGELLLLLLLPWQFGVPTVLKGKSLPSTEQLSLTAGAGRRRWAGPQPRVAGFRTKHGPIQLAGCRRQADRRRVFVAPASGRRVWQPW